MKKFFLVGLILIPLKVTVHAAASLSGTPSFTPADSGRSGAMDIGGVWNGAAEVTATAGDAVSIDVCNAAGSGFTTAFDLTGTVTFPSGFFYVDNTVAGIAGITASQAGAVLTYAIPANTDISTGTCRTVSFGVRASTAVSPGTYNFAHHFGFGQTDGAVDGSLDFGQSILVLGGASVITKTPGNQTLAVNSTAAWTVTVQNTGLGGLFDVVIDEDAINPGAALDLTTLTKSAPALALSAASSGTITLPYLAPGESFVAAVQALVTNCGDAFNTAVTRDRTGASSSINAQVTLDLLQPLVDFTLPAIAVTNASSAAVSIPIQNTGFGDAAAFVLDTNLETLGITVSGVGAGWSYNAATGEFTRTADGGTLVNASSTTLTFQAAADPTCVAPSAQSLHATAEYINVCGNPFSVPTKVVPGGVTYAVLPVVTLNQSAIAPVVSPNALGTEYQVTITMTRPDLIAEDPITVTNLLPTFFSTVTAALPVGSLSCPGGGCDGGELLTWTFPRPSSTFTVVYTATFTFTSLDVCSAGSIQTNTVETALNSTLSCPLNAASSQSIIFTNLVSTATGYSREYAILGGPHETGLPDDGDGVREAGEGEFIAVLSSYTFGSAFPGQWTGSTFLDDFGGAAAMHLRSGSLFVTVGAGAPVAVPPGSVTSSSGALLIDMAFMQGPGFVGVDALAGVSFRLDYQVQAPDAALGSGAQLGLTHFARFVVESATGACNGTTETTIFDADSHTLARASISPALAMPAVCDVCEVFTATATFTPAFFDPMNFIATMTSVAAYDYITGQTPVYGGLFNAGNMTYSENAGVNPTFLFNAGAITAPGTVSVQMRRAALSGTANTGIAVGAEYDDFQTPSNGPPQDFSSGASAAPALVRQGNVALLMTPQNVAVTGATAQWSLYVTNQGSGRAFNVEILNRLPTGLSANTAATDALNPGYPVSVVGSSMSWTVSAIQPGETIQIRLVADVDGATCAIPPGANFARVRWGCGGTYVQTVSDNKPDFTFYTGQMQVTHDSVDSFVELCDVGRDVIILRNTGRTLLTDVIAREALNPASTGIDIVPGSVEVSTNSGGTWTALGAGGDPTGAGTTADPYVWTSTQVPPLAGLVPLTESGVSEVRLRFSLSSNETSNGTPSITASGQGTQSCGNVVSDSGAAFGIPVRRPSISVEKTGRNLTAGEVTYTENVFATPGDSVEWRIIVRNAGNYTAKNARLTEVFPDSGAATTLSGPGHAGTPITSSVAVTIPDIVAGASATYTVSHVTALQCPSGPNRTDVTWGCLSNGASARSNLTSPSDNDDTAQYNTQPSFAPSTGLSQTVTALNGGRAAVAVTLTNLGGTAENMVLVSTLPAGMVFDTTFASSFTTTGGILTNTPVFGTDIATFTFTGELRNARNLVLHYRVIQSTGFDTAFNGLNFPDTTANLQDPAVPPTGNGSARILSNDGCGGNYMSSATVSINLRTPDLDMTVSPTSGTVTDLQIATFTFTITNSGDAGSVADHIFFSSSAFGAGWALQSVTVVTPGTGGTGGACAGMTCSEAQLGRLNQGASAVVRVVAQANDNGSPLTIIGRVEGSLYRNDGSDTGSDYSLDEAQPRVFGFVATKSLVSTSEAASVDPVVLIGEEATWRLRARWFGGTAISTITVRDTLPAGLGYVSHTANGGHTVTISSVTGAVAVSSGTIDFTVSDLAGGAGTFDVDLVTRLLNVAANTNGAAALNNLGLRFTTFNTVFASSAPADGFGGNQGALHQQASVTVARPAFTVDKQVRNVTNASGFADAGTGIAGDEMEYRVLITNTGAAPAFDLVLGDTLATPRLVMVGGAADGVDNDGDGAVDGGDSEGAFNAVAGGSVTFNHANTGLPVSGQNLERLDNGESRTLLYRVTLPVTVIPSEVLNNGASLTFTTLPGDTGGQTGLAGLPGASSGEAVLNSTDSAAISVSTVSFTKSLLSTSLGADVSTAVVVGEQIQYRLEFVIPGGTVPDLRIIDNLPAGLALVQTPAVTLGAGLSPQAQPTITPAVLPSSSPVQVIWDFGTVVSSPTASAAQRTVTIPYTAQVINTAGVNDGGTLLNVASFTYTGLAVPASSQLSLQVREPSVAVTKTVNPSTGTVDAGDVLTYTVTLANTGTAPGYEASIVDTLPPGLVYLSSTTNAVTGGPLGEPDVSGAVLTWGREQSAPQSLTLSTTPLQFTYQVRVTTAVEPEQTLPNSVNADWTSIPAGVDLGVPLTAAGGPLGPRDGSGGVNDYFGLSASTKTVANAFALAKAGSGDTVSGGGFRVGDLVTYTLQATFQEGRVDGVVIEDVLPAGLAFESFTPLSPAGAPFTYTPPTGINAPVSGSTGTLRWNLGTVVNDGDNNGANNTLTLVYLARVKDADGVAPTPATQNLLNTARLINETVTASTQTAGTDNETIAVKQPLLTLVKTRLTGATVAAGVTAAFRLTVANSGAAPAYNVQMRDVLPVGMRQTSPLITAATLNGGGLAPFALLGQVYNSTSGVVTWALPDGLAIDPAASLVVDYDVTIDADVGGGLTLANAATVPGYFSVDTSSPADRRAYAPLSTSTVSVNTPSPSDMLKSTSSAALSVGETITFTLFVPSTSVNVSLYDVRVQDSVSSALQISSITTNAALLSGGVCGTVTATDNTVGNAVDVDLSCIPFGQRAEITVTAVVLNLAGNQAGDAFTNQANYVWSQSPGAPSQPLINSNIVGATLREPVLSIDKVFLSSTLADAGQGLQAGDQVTYRFNITNATGANTAAAHDLEIFDVADEDLINPLVNPAPDNPGAPADLGVTAGQRTHRWTVPGPLAPGATYSFDATFTLGVGVQPQQVLVNYATVTWTSAPGANPFERDGSGGIDDYRAEDPTPVSVVVGPVHIEKTIRAPGDSDYAVGESVTYDLDFTFGQGTVQGVHILDALPAGLVYTTATLSVNNAVNLSSAAVAILSGPAPGATGALDFDMGDVMSAGASPRLTLSLTARVQDVPGNVAGTILTNGATAQITNSTGGVAGIVPMTPLPPITVLEPALRLAMDSPGTVALGSPALFIGRVVNSTAPTATPAYQPAVQIQLPPGLRALDPTTAPVAVSIDGGRSLPLVEGVDYTLAYSSATGVFTATLISAQGFVDLTETLSIQFSAALNDDAVNASTHAVTGTVTAYNSRDVSGGAVPDNRAYAHVLNAGTTGTANLAAPDDPTDDAPITVQAPVISVAKSVDKTLAVLPADAALRYTITLTNSGAIATSSSTLTDDLGAGIGNDYFVPGSMANVQVTGAGGFSDVSALSGGTNGKGLLSLENLIVPVGVVTVEFDMALEPVIPAGTVLVNQATMTVPGFSNPFVTNQTTTTIESAGDLVIQKYSADDNGGSLMPGETLTYTLVVQNRGTERVLSSLVKDAVPANTTYVPGTTVLNGAPSADVGGLSPLVAGLAVHTPADPVGTLRVCPATATVCGPALEARISFQVTVGTSVAPATLITNQGILTGTGEGSGDAIFKVSDDTSTVPSPDPTINIVAGGPYLEAEKVVADSNGPTLLPPDVLLYTITLHNRGDEAATAVTLTDVIPVNAAYVPGSLRFDTDASTATVLAPLTDAADADAGDYNVTASTALTVNVGTVTAGGELTMEFQVTLNLGVASGTVIANQGVVRAGNFPEQRTDGDGNHGNGNQPTYIVVGGATALVQRKQVTDVDGGAVLPGDLLEYRIETFNVGLTSATNVVVTDTGPTVAVYEAGTTHVNGAPQADLVGPVSPLSAGINVGTLNPGASALVQYQVRIPTGTAPGTAVENQASFAADGGLAGISDSDLDDGLESGNDGADPNDDDPTRVLVGGSPGSANLSGQVWEDLNHDRVVDPGEPPQAGWTVEVLKDGVLVASQVTDAAGLYRFAGLVPGSGYQVRFRHPLTGVVFGKGFSTRPGVLLDDGTIRNLTLSSGDNVLEQNLPLDPSGVVYDSITRLPIAGVQAFIDGPIGFVPATHLLPNQDGQTTGVDGRYRFDINFAAGAPFGTYSLRFVSPAGYVTNIPAIPSGIIPPAPSAGCAGLSCFDVPGAPPVLPIAPNNDAPVNADPTTYYLAFLFDALADANIVNNHVPLDPILDDAITVTKTSPLRTVTRGDLVPYTVKARNNYAATLTNIDIKDILPPGFKYISGSGRLAGAPLSPAHDRGTLTWSGLTFAPNEEKTFTLVLIVGSGVSEGRYKNRALARNSVANRQVSNTAEATVEVVPDATFDCAEVLGRVFLDLNANGYPDPGEAGVPDVRLANLKGQLITTDHEGRYHIACADVPDATRGSNYLLKVDPRTLPTGLRFTTENPRDARLTRGKATKINFGVTLYQVVRLDLSDMKPKAPAATVIDQEEYAKVEEKNMIPPVRFAVGKFSLLPEHIEAVRAALERVRGMTDVRDVRLAVIGHTDNAPIKGRLAKTIANNDVLSRHRADSVAAHLVKELGLAKDMIVTDGKADREPLTGNDTAEGRALNRRVEVHVVYEQRRVTQVIKNEPVPVRPDLAVLARGEIPEKLIPILAAKPSILRVAACAEPGNKADVERQLNAVVAEVRRRWKSVPDRYRLIIEIEKSFPGCADIDRALGGGQ